MARSLLTRRYPIGRDRVIVIHADNRYALGLVDFAPPREGDDGCRTSCAELFLLSGRTSARRPPGSRLVQDRRGVREYRHGETVFIDWCGRAQAHVSPATCRAVITVPRARRLNPEYLSKLVVRPVLDRLLEQSFLLFHAAGAAHEGNAVVMAGYAGSGKTTLLAELLDAGMSFLGDDRMIAMQRDPGTVYRGPDHLRRAHTPRGPKHRLTPASDGPASAELSRIVILEPGNGGMSILPLSPVETAARLIGHVIVHDRALLPRIVDAVASLCAQSPGYLIRGWGGSGDRAAAVLELVGCAEGSVGHEGR